jgi:hypothetical protein
MNEWYSIDIVLKVLARWLYILQLYEQPYFVVKLVISQFWSAEQEHHVW